MGIFKAYDIRGIYGEELNDETAYKVGRAFVKFLRPKKIVIGYDIRNSSGTLVTQLIKGVTESGCNVIDIGLCSTPMNYYANGKLEVDGSIMVTASHNPAEYNGFKLCREKAIPLSGETGIKEIEKLVEKDEWEESETRGDITKNEEIKDEYIKFISSKFEGRDKLKVVVDCANAMGIQELEALKQIENLEITELFAEPDGSFPNHEANPLKAETLKELQKKVSEINADIGIGFDGDADRVGFVDEKGEIVPMDFIGAIISEDVLSRKPGSKIFYDLRSSKIIKDIIEKNNGEPNMSRVGHAFIKEQMREIDAEFASELSGHFYFKDNFYTESSSLAAISIMNIIQSKKKKLSELSDSLKKYFHSGEINSSVKDKDAVLKALEENYSDGKILHLDGLSVTYKDWWFNVRASNTEPLLRLNLEANTKELMEEKKKELLRIIRM